MTVWRMRVAYWIHKATNTLSEYVALNAIPLQQLFQERSSALRYIYIPRMFVVIIAVTFLNPLNAELNPICPLLALFGAHHILHVSR